MIRELEVCTGSYQDCLLAYQAGAKQVELNSALSLGGLSPSIVTLQHIKKNTDLLVNCMVRLRPGGFLYSETEFQLMLDEAKCFLDSGADGIVFGFLLDNFEIDKARTQAMVDLVHSYQKKAIFHRAFDLTNNACHSIETLIQCGIDRVLTSGLKTTAIEGKDCLSYLQKQYGDQIEILAGCGLNKNNVKDFIYDTDIKMIHSSCKGYNIDPTTQHNGISYAYVKQSNQYESTNVHDVKIMLKILNDL